MIEVDDRGATALSDHAEEGHIAGTTDVLLRAIEGDVLPLAAGIRHVHVRGCRERGAARELEGRRAVGPQSDPVAAIGREEVPERESRGLSVARLHGNIADAVTGLSLALASDDVVATFEICDASGSGWRQWIELCARLAPQRDRIVRSCGRQMHPELAV